MTFEEFLDELGFGLVQQNRSGARRYVMRGNPYLQWFVVLSPEGSVELSWEFELGAYLRAKGFHVSVQDELSLLLFPTTDARGPADPDWLATEMAAAQARLDSVDLHAGT